MASWKEQFNFKPGDLNGFVQLFFDNTATLLVLVGNLQLVLTGFYNNGLTTEMYEGNFTDIVGPSIENSITDVIYMRSIPGLGFTMVFGNVYYTFLGMRLGVKEKRIDVTALPYGVNTPAAFAFCFSILGPVAITKGVLGCNTKLPLTSTEEAEAYASCWDDAIYSAWGAGVVSNFLVGIISVVLGFLGDYVLLITPNPALLTALSGVGIAFLGIAQIGETFVEPLIGLLPLFLVIAGYYGDIPFSGPIPLSLSVCFVAVLLGWWDGIVNLDSLEAAAQDVNAYGVKTGVEALSDWSEVGTYIGTIIPLAIAAAASTLMNVMSAEKAGDSYPLKETMVSDGFGTIIGAFFGTPFGTSVYIGHPAYKKFGAGVAYSMINCILFFIFSMFGVFSVIQAFIPVQGVAPLILFVGLMICKEALESMPSRQFPSFILGLLPAIADWSQNLAVVDPQCAGDYCDIVFDNGIRAIAFASLLLSLILTTISYYIIERNLTRAWCWTLVAAILSAFGIIHADKANVEFFIEPNPVYQMNEKMTQWRFMTGYLITAATLGIFDLVQRFTNVFPGPREEWSPCECTMEDRKHPETMAGSAPVLRTSHVEKPKANDGLQGENVPDAEIVEAEAVTKT